MDKVRSFAEARSPDAAEILGGLSYGDAREIVAEIDRLRAALGEAASSLRALSVAGLRDRSEYLQHMEDVRGYAHSRATVASEVLAAHKEGEG